MSKRTSEFQNLENHYKLKASISNELDREKTSFKKLKERKDFSLKKNLMKKKNFDNSQIIRERPKENFGLRIDARGIPIRKGNKKYKVTFKDLISKENLVNYIEVEDYKRYNQVNIKAQEYESEGNDTSRTCKIF